GAYNDVAKLNTDTGNNAFGQPESKLVRCSEQKTAAKELPEYLKQKLRARVYYFQPDNLTYKLSVFEFQKGTSAEVRGDEKLAPGWIEVH
ncbi:group ii intron-encoded protein ltra, partial [Trifolium pratense]